MSRLEIRLFGGFDARVEGRAIHGFESQKVRGLFAFLACHRSQPLGRDRLASLLWGEKPDDTARRNLRQALHNLRLACSKIVDPDSIFEVTHSQIRIRPTLDCWVDVEQFEESVRRAFVDELPDHFQLTVAARLYTGDFLSGFFVRDSPPFEEWLVTEQERLREAAIESYRSLINAYLGRGEYRLGIQYARRLLATDPLSEEAHRYLMRLYAVSGRRAQALSQFEKLRNLLNVELGVEPLEETRELYDSILAEDLPTPTGGVEEEPVGPVIPLVGRREALARLQNHWQEVLEEGGLLSLVEGETGIGKSRLIRSFTDAATSRRRALVLRGRCYDSAPVTSYQPFAEFVLSGFSDLLPEEIAGLIRPLQSGVLSALVRIAPPLTDLLPANAPPLDKAPPLQSSDVFTALLAFLDRLAEFAGSRAEPAPLILMLEDLQWCDQGSLDLLAALLPELRRRAAWVLATCRSGRPQNQRVSRSLAAGIENGAVRRVPLSRLGREAVQEIASSLVGVAGSLELSSFLMASSDGLPLAVAELINLLWDEGLLVPRGHSQWTLAGDPKSASPPENSLPRLIQMRIRRLPASARRIVSVAAVLGQRFDAQLVQRAANEHLAVVELCIQLLLERWLIRQFPATWSDSRRERDIVLWVKGARRGQFEFAHEAIRRAILEDINPIRRRAMHGQVAQVLRQVYGHEEGRRCEQLAHHEVAAGHWLEALPCLEEATRRARNNGAREVALWYLERHGEAVARALQGKLRDAVRGEIESRRRALTQELQALTETRHSDNG